MARSGFHIEIRGTVQGVGFRPWVYQLAQRLGVAGRVWNDSNGVSIDAFGAPDALDRFLVALQDGAPLAARIRSVKWTQIPSQDLVTFTIAESSASPERQVSIPADLATCPDCLHELFDPTDRRYRYAFINCTNCGPRYSIATGIPYDRVNTSMRSFEMCVVCRREYESPNNRRFHAQPNACPACGPQVVAMTPQRQEVATADPVSFAARAIRAGLVVAVKGIGGFHLACDATSPQAVRRLRERKRRETRPFAVMVRDMRDAESLARLGDAERDQLLSVERPIVLAHARPGSRLAPEVSGDVPLVGLFLPYTPLHHLLLHDCGMPLVMTSGNVSDEPMVTDNAEAFERLREIADVFLLHDRQIVTRVDDSVVRVIGGSPVVLRRARGSVPRAIDAGREFAQPILGCGAHLKNTFCIATGSSAFLGPHIGDLESVATLHAYEKAIERMEGFLGVTPHVFAHDLHPDFLPTRYALARGGTAIAVQHHHAHVASAMAEAHLEGPVLGIAFDGTGYGTDGTSWGGEFLIASYAGFERFATFRPIALAEGEQAILQPWRTALALLDDAFGGDAPLQRLPLFRAVPPHAIDAVRRMIAHNLNTSAVRGVGRYFDAFGALFLGTAESRYEGDLAFRWNMAADDGESGRYPVVVHEGARPWTIDPRPMVRAAVDDFLAGASPAVISARFHNTLALATVEIARAALAVHGSMPVVLSGGCFMNARLAESVMTGLAPAARVVMHREVPPGDGGIALGQVLVADAQIRAGRTAGVADEAAVCALVSS